MNSWFNPAAAAPDARLEAELAVWLRSIEPALMPIAARLRISADLRADAADRRRFLPRTSRLVAAAVWLVVLLAGAGAFLLLVAGTGATQSGVGGPVAPTLLPISATPGASTSPVLMDLRWLAFIVALGILVGASTNLRPIRAAVARVVLGYDENVAEPAAALPRRLRSVPRLALALAVLPIILVAWTTYLYWPSGQWLSTANLSPWISISLPACLAFAIALRYSARDRGARWLLTGGIAIAITTLPNLALGTAAELGWFDHSDWGVPLSMASPFVGYTLAAVGWTALAMGVAARAGRISGPRWFVVAAVVGVVVYFRVSAALTFAAFANLSAQDVPRLVYQSATSVVIGLAGLWVLWTGLVCSRRHCGRAWTCLLVAAAAGVCLDAAGFLATVTGRAFLPSEWYLYLDWLSLGALLLALLMGLNPIRDATAGDVPASD